MPQPARFILWLIVGEICQVTRAESVRSRVAEMKAAVKKAMLTGGKQLAEGTAPARRKQRHR